MIFIIGIIALIAWGIYQFNKAEKRANAIISGSPKKEKPNWQERFAIALIPHVIEINEKRRLRGEIVRSPPKPWVDYGRAAVNDRLEDAFQNFRSRSIGLQDYKEIVRHEEAAVRDKIEDTRAAKRGLPRSNDMHNFYDEEIEEARDALEEVRWRLDWIKDREKDEGDEDRLPSSSHNSSSRSVSAPKPNGVWASFDYTNGYGTFSHRDIINWVDHGLSIRGYDQNAEGGRTFLKDNIQNWQGSSPLAPSAGIAKPNVKYGPVIQGPVMNEIFFEYRGVGKEPALASAINWIEYEKHIAGWDKQNNKIKVFAKKQISEFKDGAGEQIKISGN
ncbi:MAG: hypothetical protein E2598_06345 [Sphingobium sp.]|nr:hypothetical protein [Sphingobium sp.]